MSQTVFSAFKTLAVPRAPHPPALDGQWDAADWAVAEPFTLDCFMGARPEPFPRTQARLLYDDRALYVAFRVEDRFVRAITEHLHGRVWEDSCVEFFFTPGEDLGEGYFNLEMNCGGTIIMRHQHHLEDENFRLLEASDAARIEIFHGLPKIVNPEIQEPITWVVQYRLPLDILSHYAPFVPPAPGVTWRANFYKCADASSHPHWITWSPIARPEPLFHLPEFFGFLKFL